MCDIQRVGPADEAALLNVLAAADRYRRDFTDHRTPEAWMQSLLEEREIDAQRDVYLARIGSNAVAAVELVEEGGAMTIAQLIVAEPFRFLGYGRRITEWVLAQGHDLITLGVATQNRGAVAFWESMGFYRTGKLGKGTQSLTLMERSAAGQSLHGLAAE